MFIVVQVFSYGNFSAPINENERIYFSYSEKLSGSPSPEKDMFLAEEEEHFNVLRKKLEHYLEITGNDEMLVGLLAGDIIIELRKEEAFREAKAQYEGLEDGQEYIYKTGYERLYQSTGIQDDIINLAKLMFFLIIALAGTFSIEQETGVAVLQVAAGKTKAVARKKLIHAGCVLLLALMIAYLPQYIAVANAYGIPQVTAQANSLSIFSKLSYRWHIWEIILVQNFIRLALGFFAAAVILLLSRKTGSLISTLLLSMGILLIPIIAVFFLMHF